MFFKPSTIMVLTCLAFIIFPKGSEALDCTKDAMYKCSTRTYESTQPPGTILTPKEKHCSFLKSYKSCLQHVLDYCETQIVIQAAAVDQGNKMWREIDKEETAWKCVKNGEESRKMSLIVIAVACLFALKFYQ